MQDQVNAFPDRYALYLGIENEKKFLYIDIYRMSIYTKTKKK